MPVETKPVVLLVGIPGLKDTRMIATMFTDISTDEAAMRDSGKKFRCYVADNLVKNFNNLGMPLTISGFTPKDFFWAVLENKDDPESLLLASDNFYDSNYWKNS